MMILKKLALTKFFMGKYFIIQEDFQLPPNKQLDCMTCSLPGEVKLIKFTVYKHPFCPSGSGPTSPVPRTPCFYNPRPFLIENMLVSVNISAFWLQVINTAVVLVPQKPQMGNHKVYILFQTCFFFLFCLKVILFYNLNDIKCSSYFWITVFYMTVKTFHFKYFIKHIESKISKIKPCSLCGLS